MSDEEMSRADTSVVPQAGQPASLKPAPAEEKIDSLPSWAQGIITELRSENAKYRIAKAESERRVQAATELAEKLQQQAQRAEHLEQAISALLEDETARVPERFRGLIPDLAPEQKLKWLREAREVGLLNQLVPPTTDARGGIGGGVAVRSDAERRELAARLGVPIRYLSQ